MLFDWSLPKIQIAWRFCWKLTSWQCRILLFAFSSADSFVFWVNRKIAGVDLAMIAMKERKIPYKKVLLWSLGSCGLLIFLICMYSQPTFHWTRAASIISYMSEVWISYQWISCIAATLLPIKASQSAAQVIYTSSFTRSPENLTLIFCSHFRGLYQCRFRVLWCHIVFCHDAWWVTVRRR